MGLKLHIIAGARPNFMKIAPIIKAIKNKQEEGVDIQFRLIHTGQHYDPRLSGTFFEQLNIPQPNANLEVGSGSQAEQTAQIMIKYEQELLSNPCDVVLVVGDVNSTMACTIVAKKLNVDVAHIEGGIRSLDLTMPEEINRMVTDSISDYFFTTSEYANENLLKEGKNKHQIYYVGNTMIDTLCHQLPNISPPKFWTKFQLQSDNYILLTMHRPANVDDENKLRSYLDKIISLSGKKIIFPVHPRTLKTLEKINYNHPNLFLVEPQGYHQFIYLLKNAYAVITDSGGVQEESTYLEIPCITLRDNTERYETVSEGTNELIGTNPSALDAAFEKLNRDTWKKGQVPKYWDGKTSEKIINNLIQIFNNKTNG